MIDLLEKLWDFATRFAMSLAFWVLVSWIAVSLFITSCWIVELVFG